MKHARLALLAASLAATGAVHAATFGASPTQNNTVAVNTINGKIEFNSTFSGPSFTPFHNSGSLYATDRTLSPKTLLGYWKVTANEASDLAVTQISSSGGNASSISANPNDGTTTLSSDIPMDLGGTPNKAAASGLQAHDEVYIGLYSMNRMTTNAMPTDVQLTVTSYKN
ncbi:hypothetical protein MVS59_004906 [Salmonella enterica]|nr:hypothetical protein [Salmonella enterica subsp. diarizonae serovar 48:i:z]EEH1876041.1 hypothetical protein [Salmonella enterica]EEM2740595.1 hypothetical protein [Salmonella enterica]EEM9677014.1 hypothetical protein [Salmonella enterica]EEN5935798.1 hypothetical protein [Salmonella enterica]